MAEDLKEIPLALRWGSSKVKASGKGQSFNFKNGYPIQTPLESEAIRRMKTTVFQEAKTRALEKSASEASLQESLRETFNMSGTNYFARFRQSALREEKGPQLPFHASSALPKFISQDRKVLRFYAYFKEAVNESRLENFRVRKCILYVFLEDDTMSIAEPRVENSGIPQGQFVKRGLIPKNSAGEPYTLDDLQVGVEINVYGRVFRIVDADKSTRAYMDGLGQPLTAPEAYPEDKYTLSREEHMRLETGADPTIPRGSKMSSMKKFMEARMGKFYSGQSLEKFLKNDRQVLRFYCVWDNRRRLYGKMRRYTMNYFLTDDTVEILEKSSVGEQPFPRMLNRSRLPKNYLQLPKTGICDAPASMFYSPKDFKVGAIINVFNRNLKILDCDESTRAWYDKNFEPGFIGEAIVIEEKKKEIVRPPPPPHNGFGSEEDSLRSCTSLRPRPPKLDFTRFMEFDNKILKWAARFANAKPQNKDRVFIIALYLADNTLSIFETRGPNSGIVGGKFLERGPYRKTVPGVGKVKYQPEDFVVGSVVTVNSYKFLVEGVESKTQSYLAGEQETHDVGSLIGKLKNKIKHDSEHLTRAFRLIDEDHNGFLTFSEFKLMLKEVFAEDFPDKEVIQVMFYFDPNQNGIVEYSEFSKVVSPDDAWMSSSDLFDGKGILLEPPADEHYLALAKQVSESAKKKQHAKRIIKAFAHQFFAKRHELAQTFRTFDHDHSGKLSKAEFKQALKVSQNDSFDETAGFNLTDDEIDILVDHFYDAEGDEDGDGELDYTEFMDTVWHDEAGEIDATNFFAS